MWDATAVRIITVISVTTTIQQSFLFRSSWQGLQTSDASIMIVEVELFIQWVSTGYIFDPVSTVLVSKSIFDLVSLRNLSPRMRGCANDDTTIAGVGVGHTFRSKSMST